ncbi:hypothetical protein BV22DRAFT_1035813 [Leucogyrophana mollusca]|uniref:Uncharacterized protein n=1 Tax=Leucogyrophana mollusca TaxID=85980 RepID=A0ACB8BDS9_9AGAM|nr:hypothetical protein BV22DRAFT_1035813 [Leucogyrophana mollusca]
MGSTQSRAHSHKAGATTVTRSGKHWPLSQRHKRSKKSRRRSKDYVASPVVDDPAPWVSGHKVFVVLDDGQGLFLEGRS